MFNRHYAHAALYMKCMNACVPSELKLKLESIEAPEANLMSNENATDYAKRLLSNGLFDSTLLPAIERKMADVMGLRGESIFYFNLFNFSSIMCSI
jgi:hypothetical protein